MPALKCAQQVNHKERTLSGLIITCSKKKKKVISLTVVLQAMCQSLQTETLVSEAARHDSEVISFLRVRLDV